MTLFRQDDLDQVGSEIALRECCQSGCTACVLDYDQADQDNIDLQVQSAESDLLAAIQKACELADIIEPDVRED